MEQENGLYPYVYLSLVLDCCVVFSSYDSMPCVLIPADGEAIKYLSSNFLGNGPLLKVLSDIKKYICFQFLVNHQNK